MPIAGRDWKNGSIRTGRDRLTNIFVMAGLDPAIHDFSSRLKTWMPGASPGMTVF